MAQAFTDEAAIDGADVVICLQLTPELAERLAVVDLVVFIDAAAGIQPGSIAVTQLQRRAGTLDGPCSPLESRGIALLIQQPLRPIAGRFPRRGGRRLPGTRRRAVGAGRSSRARCHRGGSATGAESTGARRFSCALNPARIHPHRST